MFFYFLNTFWSCKISLRVQRKSSGDLSIGNIANIERVLHISKHRSGKVKKKIKNKLGHMLIKKILLRGVVELKYLRTLPVDGN